jgi:hypothetical protein
MLGALYVQQGYFREAKKQIFEIIVEKDWKAIYPNLLLALMYEK